MRRNQNKANNDKHDNGNGLIPNSFRFISSYIKTVSTNVRSAGASVSGSVSGDSSDELRKDQVLWSCFDNLELTPTTVKHVLLLGYSNGFQVLDVDNGSNFIELVSIHDDPVTFLQIQPTPVQTKGEEGFKMSHPLLLVAACEETGSINTERDESQMEYSPRAVRFYSLKSHSYVHVLRFRSTVYMVRCSPRIVAVGLASQIYCFDALTLENKFSVLTYPISQLSGINIGYGPMTVGPRWLAYASNNPLLLSNTGRLSPQNLTPSPGVSPSTSPVSGSLMARYASKQLANGLINLGDMSYRTLSKYCLPEGSTSPSRKAGRTVALSTENANAGMVVIKDFVSRAIVSQFRAHASPISALCFDPSGTLLVTASVHGNNINIFRILPSQSDSSSQNNNWNSAHVHLYKLHRGMTSAVIQDICFSQYSEWIAVTSSRGTCHIFQVSPFGGDQLQNSKVKSIPWWSTSSFTNDQSLSPPPPAAITLSVVSRIKNVNFGWINSNGKTSAPPGAISATFHSSICQNLAPVVSNMETLEHLLVYSPSGYVIQYELLPAELKVGTGSQVQVQDEDLRVKVEPVQWWDVCRRTDWPEKQEFVGGPTCSVETVMSNDDDEDSKRHEPSRWYLSHAEVQIKSGRIPVWQKSKMYFYVMGPQELNDDAGEVDIETIPVNEVEVSQKDLLPVFDSSRPVYPDGRVVTYSASSSTSGSHKQKFTQDSTVSHGSSLESADVQHLKQTEQPISYPILASTVNNNDSANRSSPFTGFSNVLYSSLDDIMNSSSPVDGSIAAIGKSVESIVTSDTSNPGSNRSDLSLNVVDEVPMNEHDFDHDHCKPIAEDKSCKFDEMADVEGNKSEVDGDNDDMLGGVFAFEEC